MRFLRVTSRCPNYHSFYVCCKKKKKNDLIHHLSPPLLAIHREASDIDLSGLLRSTIFNNVYYITLYWCTYSRVSRTRRGNV